MLYLECRDVWSPAILRRISSDESWSSWCFLTLMYLNLILLIFLLMTTSLFSVVKHEKEHARPALLIIYQILDWDSVHLLGESDELWILKYSKTDTTIEGKSFRIISIMPIHLFLHFTFLFPLRRTRTRKNDNGVPVRGKGSTRSVIEQLEICLLVLSRQECFIYC